MTTTNLSSAQSELFSQVVPIRFFDPKKEER